MPWFKVDDKLHDHRKARKAGKAAMGVWVLAGSWCGNNLTDGFVPQDIFFRWGTKKDAVSLVDAGLWAVAEKDGEQGWQFHNWTDFQPTKAKEEEKSRLKAKAGRKGGIMSGRSRSQAGAKAGASHVVEPRPDPTRPVLKDPSSEIADAISDEANREDVDRLCDRLAEHIESNGGKRPNITKGWRDAARLLIDRDGRTEQQIAWMVDWCQRDEFWHTNILSMPKLREKFDQLVLKARPQGNQTGLRLAANGEPYLPPAIDDKR